MSGTSIIFPDATLAQADVLASLWCPEGIAPLLVQEYVMGGSAAATIANRAAADNAGALVGNPQIGDHSLVVATPASAGIETGILASEVDQTFVIVCRGGGSGGIFSTAGAFTGILGGINGDPWAFYNSQSGVAPGIAVTPYLGSGYQFVVGWGSQGDFGRICTGQAGGMKATVAGTVGGNVRSTATVKIGGGVYSGAFDIAYAARVPAILTDAQRLAWYRTLRGDGTAQGSPLGVAVA